MLIKFFHSIFAVLIELIEYPDSKKDSNRILLKPKDVHN